ncbi:PREDICTED: uncharacterized protein LOC109177142 [Ipomoea nil]|uniref:uncharacterized protein LOC109177142 n=1 Tax=Ipomoea nil TaxID=35883 RepID=UPI000901AF11|nr:PREDICTED: uncharacterized protein LOC109177142 [Ipomoea nil]
MGDKSTAKETMKNAGVPTVLGSDGLLQRIPYKIISEIFFNELPKIQKFWGSGVLFGGAIISDIKPPARTSRRLTSELLWGIADRSSAGGKKKKNFAGSYYSGGLRSATFETQTKSSRRTVKVNPRKVVPKTVQPDASSMDNSYYDPMSVLEQKPPVNSLDCTDYGWGEASGWTNERIRESLEVNEKSRKSLDVKDKKKIGRV